MTDIPINELLSMSDGELQTCLRRINEEINRREATKRQKLIDNFKEAFYALREARVYIKYYEDEYHDDYTSLTDWDGFDFT